MTVLRGLTNQGTYQLQGSGFCKQRMAASLLQYPKAAFPDCYCSDGWSDAVSSFSFTSHALFQAIARGND